MRTDVLGVGGKAALFLVVGCNDRDQAALLEMLLWHAGGAILFLVFALLMRAARWCFEPAKTERHLTDEQSPSEPLLFGPITLASHPPPPPAPGRFEGFIASSGGLCKVRNQKCENEQRCRAHGCLYN